jgi:DNA-binding MarR family transcriptional regulator
MDRHGCSSKGMTSSPQQAARAFAELFPTVFQLFHRRGPKRSLLTPQGWAVLQHLAMSGPLTVSEAARHMGRAQSVMSEMVDHLQDKGLLARMRDARDRRRVLVWLTDAGRAELAREREVLSVERLTQAFALVPDQERAHLLRSLQTLLQAGAPAAASHNEPTRRKP